MKLWAFVPTGCRVCSVGTDSSGAGEAAGGKEQHTDPGRQLVSEGSPGPLELIWYGPGHQNEMPKLQGNQEKCSPGKTENLSPHGFSAGNKAVQLTLEQHGLRAPNHCTSKIHIEILTPPKLHYQQSTVDQKSYQ